MSAPAIEHPIPKRNNVFRTAGDASSNRPVESHHVVPQHDSTARLASIAAHVRVLQVGTEHLSRHLFNQLDVVPASSVTAIGRVRVRPQQGAGVDLVGVQADGTLATATIRPPTWTGGGSLDLDHFAQHLHPEWVGRNVAVASDNGRRLHWRVDVFPHPPKATSKGSRIRCGLKHLEATWRAAAREELAEVVAAQQAYDTALSLPLLVLAGR